MNGQLDKGIVNCGFFLNSIFEFDYYQRDVIDVKNFIWDMFVFKVLDF